MMTDGFLGYKTSFMLDFVVVALLIIVPCLIYSLWLARVARHYSRHRTLQIGLGVVLLIAVAAFEIDLQVVHGGWQNIVAKQELDDAALAARISAVYPWLYFHLIFAVTTPFLWITTLVLALRRFGNPPLPGAHSRTHRILGWASAIDITLTSVTGLWFYYLAFVKP